MKLVEPVRDRDCASEWSATSPRKSSLEVIGQRVISRPQVRELSMTADRRNFARIEQRGARRQVLEGTVGVPETIGLRKRAQTARVTPDFVAQVEIRDVGEFGANAQLRVLVKRSDADLERPDSANW